MKHRGKCDGVDTYPACQCREAGVGSVHALEEDGSRTICFEKNTGKHFELSSSVTALDFSFH